jgi:hypothetical protein
MKNHAEQFNNENRKAIACYKTKQIDKHLLLVTTIVISVLLGMIGFVSSGVAYFDQTKTFIDAITIVFNHAFLLILSLLSGIFMVFFIVYVIEKISVKKTNPFEGKAKEFAFSVLSQDLITAIHKTFKLDPFEANLIQGSVNNETWLDENLYFVENKEVYMKSRCVVSPRSTLTMGQTQYYITGWTFSHMNNFRVIVDVVDTHKIVTKGVIFELQNIK